MYRRCNHIGEALAGRNRDGCEAETPPETVEKINSHTSDGLAGRNGAEGSEAETPPETVCKRHPYLGRSDQMEQHDGWKLTPCRRPCPEYTADGLAGWPTVCGDCMVLLTSSSSGPESCPFYLAIKSSLYTPNDDEPNPNPNSTVSNSEAQVQTAKNCLGITITDLNKLTGEFNCLFPSFLLER